MFEYVIIETFIYNISINTSLKVRHFNFSKILKITFYTIINYIIKQDKKLKI